MVTNITDKTNILWQLSRIRTDNKREELRRREEIETLHPDVTAIDDEIIQLSLKEARNRIMSDNTDREASTKALQESTKLLLRKGNSSLSPTATLQTILNRYITALFVTTKASLTGFHASV